MCLDGIAGEECGFECADFQSLTLQDPAIPVAAEVCPRCRQQVNRYRFFTDDGLLITTYHCVAHGDVIPQPAAGTPRDPFPLNS